MKVQYDLFDCNKTYWKTPTLGPLPRHKEPCLEAPADGFEGLRKGQPTVILQPINNLHLHTAGLMQASMLHQAMV